MRALFLICAACSASAPVPAADRGLAAPVVAVAQGCSDGCACYPSDNIGAAPGDHIPNFIFQGVDGSFSLCDFYDPQQKKPIELIELLVLDTWNGFSNAVADLVYGTNFTGANVNGVHFASDLAPLGVVFVVVIGNGALSELTSFVAGYGAPPGTVGLDLANNLASLHDPAAVPFSITIDARSVEILAENIGFDTQMEVTLKNWVSWIQNNPPKP